MHTKINLYLFCACLLVACGAPSTSDTSYPGAESTDTQPGRSSTVEVAQQEDTASQDVDSTAPHQHYQPIPVTPGPTQVEHDLKEIAAQTGIRLRDQTAGLAKLAHNSSYVHAPLPRALSLPENRERYPEFANNGVHWTSKDPVSTFSIDVDTAAYANVRRMLNQGQLPTPDAVRVEEMINYFSYDYPRVTNSEVPFRLYTEMGPSPWHAQRRLLHVGINGWQPEANANLPAANLVFLIDVSGSMQAPNKIELLKNAMKLLVRQLRPQDTLSIAVYAGSSGEVLAPTPGNQKAKINAALEQLQAGGSTNGGAGIRLAYALAQQNFVAGGINRVILATDGDFNVGTTDIDDLERLVEQKRKSGVSLTVLGFGAGNYNDHLMQKIAQIGNGNAAYIDTIHEARKVLVDELGATLNTIAKDVKIQLEFNPAVVESYRLIGYETRHLNREDFNNDQVDAGEIGAGHTVTALYELTLVGEGNDLVDPLRYQNQNSTQTARKSLDNSEAEIGFLKLRYKAPNGERSKLVQQALRGEDIVESLDATSTNFRFSAAVAWMGQRLRNSTHVPQDNFMDMIALAQSSRGDDVHGYRSEFINLARSLEALSLVQIDVNNYVPNGSIERAPQDMSKSG